MGHDKSLPGAGAISDAQTGGDLTTGDCRPGGGQIQGDDQVPGHDHDHGPGRPEGDRHHHGRAHDDAHHIQGSGCGCGLPEIGGSGKTVLVLRPHSGISGDIMVAGLASILGLNQPDVDDCLADLGLMRLLGRVRLGPRVLGGIAGHGLHVDLQPETVHRTLSDIEAFLEAADITDRARSHAARAFRILAEAEGRVHGRQPSEVHFHEVGAVDSLLDIGLASVLFDKLDPSVFVSGPLPLCDGTIECAHGLLPSPAPAVSVLLEGVDVCGLASRGETVTPTGLALVKSFGAVFGPWPHMTVARQALVYGTRVLPGVPNGARFAYGRLVVPESSEPGA